MSARNRVRRLLNVFGVEVQRFPQQHPVFRQVKQLNHHRIDCVVDVGASDGRYACDLRRFGFAARIVSFEPLEQSFRVLSKRAGPDSRWTVFPYALGAQIDTPTLHIAGNEGASSSLLPMLPIHRTIAPDASYVGEQRVEQRTLDSLWRDFATPDDRLFLKLDVQGYERSVLEGAQEFLAICVGLQLELSLVPLYEGDMPYTDALALVAELGLELTSITPGFSDSRTGRVLQVDAMFFRESQGV